MSDLLKAIEDYKTERTEVLGVAPMAVPLSEEQFKELKELASNGSAFMTVNDHENKVSGMMIRITTKGHPYVSGHGNQHFKIYTDGLPCS